MQKRIEIWKAGKPTASICEGKEKKMLSVTEIKRFIDEDMTSERKRKAAEGQRYYEAEHDILKSRLFFFNADGNLEEDKTRSNIKISHPFFMELADQLSAYMLSFDEHPIRAKESAETEGLQEYLDQYFDDDFWSEIGDLINGAYVKGFDYLYAYKDENNRLTFEVADAMGVVEVQGRYTKDKQDYKIYHYLDTDLSEKGKRMVRRIQVWTNEETHFFIQDNESGKITKDNTIELNPRPHVMFDDGTAGEPLGFIPFWRLDNNKKQFSGLKPIKALIDDYDLMECGLSNNLADFDTPLHVVSGFQGDNLDELQTNLKTKKIVGVDAEGDVQIRTVDIPYQARKVKADEDEKNIYRFGFGFNSAQVGDGNITNIVIRSRYALLDLKANKLEKRVKKLLKTILKTVLDEINTVNGTAYTMDQVEIKKFERSIMTNETENIANEKVKAETKQLEINIILNVAANVGDEQTLKAICEVMDWDFEELQGELKKLQEEQNLIDAKKTLEGVVIEDEEDEIIDPEGVE